MDFSETFILLVQCFFYAWHLHGVSLPLKTGRQSFVWDGHNVSSAIDGNLTTYSSTFGGDAVGWIQVDLGGFYNIKGVALTNAPGNDSQYLVDFQVLVGTTDQVIDEVQSCFVYSNLPPISSGQTYSMDCNGDFIVGRYVTIRKHSGPNKTVLVLAELAVYGISNVSALNLVQPEMPVWQSADQYPGYDAKMAIDGNLQSCAFTAVEEVSRRGEPGWWTIDLQEPKKVAACVLVNLKNRYFEPYSYMKRFDVHVTNDTSKQFSEGDLCNSYSYHYLESPGYLLYLPCKPGGLVGRYVTVINANESNPNPRMDAITLCEFYALESIESLEVSAISTSHATQQVIRTTTFTSTQVSTAASTYNPIISSTYNSLTSSTYNPTNFMTESISSTSSTSTTTTTRPATGTYLTIATSSSHNDDHISMETATSALASSPFDSSTPVKTSGIYSGNETKGQNNSVGASPDHADGSRQLRLGLGIGLGLGLGLLLLLTVVLLIVCCIKKKETRKNRRKNEWMKPTLYVHPRTKLASSQMNALDSVDFSYVPDLPWGQRSQA